MGSSARIRGRRSSLPDVIHIAILKPAEVSSEISAGFFAFLSSKRLPDLQWKVTGGNPNMTNEQKAVIRRLRQQNNSYVSIANTLGVSVSAVKGYCQRNGLTGLRAAAESTPDDPSVCLGCGKPITSVRASSASSSVVRHAGRHGGTPTRRRSTGKQSTPSPAPAAGSPSPHTGTEAGSTAPTSATSPTGSREVRHDGTGAV